MAREARHDVTKLSRFIFLDGSLRRDAAPWGRYLGRHRSGVANRPRQEAGDEACRRRTGLPGDSRHPAIDLGGRGALCAAEGRSRSRRNAAGGARHADRRACAGAGVDAGHGGPRVPACGGVGGGELGWGSDGG
jgi:hypothetical protein